MTMLSGQPPRHVKSLTDMSSASRCESITAAGTRAVSLSTLERAQIDIDGMYA